MLGTLLKSYFFTKYRSFSSREQLEKWQNHRVMRHLQWVMSHSLFYRELYKNLNPAKWREFPIIAKREMMEYFDTLNTCQIKREEAYNIAIEAEENPLNPSAMGEITVGLSSGTSGSRGLFLVSPHERFSWAGAMLAKTLPGGFLSRHKIAFFFRTISSLYTSIRSKTIQFEYYPLQNSMDEHIHRLNHQQPTLLAAPPSMLRKLAAESKSGNLRINPRKIISIAEVLDPIDETFISAAFNQKIHQIYQATEGFLATTCEYGTLHLNEDILVIQKERIPDSVFKFYPIITDFSRFSQPIIRYRLNDILHECKKRCLCGSLFTAVKFIEGRSDDIFYFQSGQVLKPIFPDFIRRAIITADPCIEEYVAIQTSPRDLEIMLKTSIYDESPLQKAVHKKLIHLMQEHHVDVPHISFCPYQESLATKKLRRIERRFHVEEELIP
jgi:putative adenylate-forming enzyme